MKDDAAEIFGEVDLEIFSVDLCCFAWFLWLVGMNSIFFFHPFAFEWVYLCHMICVKCTGVCGRLLTLCVLLRCLHHVDFLRIARSWICTNGRRWNMTKRGGDLHQHDADADADAGGTRMLFGVPNLHALTRKTRPPVLRRLGSLENQPVHQSCFSFFMCPTEMKWMNILLIIHDGSKFKIPAVAMVFISKIKTFPSMRSFHTYLILVN